MDVDLKIMIPAAVALISASVLLIVRGIAFGLFQRWAAKTDTKIDDITVSSLKTPSIYWCIAIGLYIGIAISELPAKYIFHISKAINVIVILSVTMAVANVAGKLFSEHTRNTSLSIPATGLAYGILKGTILVLGFLIILSVFGISITPLITALGIGGLAIALALQDTLSNFFAGIHILMEKAVRSGDFIKLETGQEGYVTDITWRTTRIRMLPNNMVIIPNSKLSQSIVTNYYLPGKDMSMLIPVGVSYSSDPETVERILVDEANKAVGKIPGLLADPAPFVRFIPGFGEGSLDFTLICQVREFVDQYFVEHEVRKRILTRFREEGIELSYHCRTVYVREDKG